MTGFAALRSGSGETQHCERHPDGQYICYLPAKILKEVRIVVHTVFFSFLSAALRYLSY